MNLFKLTNVTRCAENENFLHSGHRGKRSVTCLRATESVPLYAARSVQQRQRNAEADANRDAILEKSCPRPCMHGACATFVSDE